jgi:hypothetical protein
MKKAYEMFTKDDRSRKAVVFKKKGSSELLGFTTKDNLRIRD